MLLGRVKLSRESPEAHVDQRGRFRSLGRENPTGWEETIKGIDWLTSMKSRIIQVLAAV